MEEPITVFTEVTGVLWGLAPTEQNNCLTDFLSCFPDSPIVITESLTTENLIRFNNLATSQFMQNIVASTPVLAALPPLGIKSFEIADYRKLNNVDKYIVIGAIRSHYIPLQPNLVMVDPQKGFHCNEHVKSNIKYIEDGVTLWRR